MVRASGSDGGFVGAAGSVAVSDHHVGGAAELVGREHGELLGAGSQSVEGGLRVAEDHQFKHVLLGLRRAVLDLEASGAGGGALQGGVESRSAAGGVGDGDVALLGGGTARSRGDHGVADGDGDVVGATTTVGHLLEVSGRDEGGLGTRGELAGADVLASFRGEDEGDAHDAESENESEDGGEDAHF